MKLLFKTVIILLLTISFSRASTTADTNLIKSHLTILTKTNQFRTFDHIDQLNKTADYIKSVFSKYADSVSIQEYQTDGRTYKNVICSFGTVNPKRIIVGAHYDVCGKQEGADDNATGITGLLELARLLQGKKLNYRIDLVAYSLEEPPYFRTKHMGSYVHAKSLSKGKIDVYGMISLEMIGYFKDEPKTQHYPLGFFSWFYGNKGNYITLVKKWGAGRFARRFIKDFISSGAVLTKKFTGPRIVPGLDWSDHLNYWKFHFSALMITDTSFYRNRNYHHDTDKMETIDINRMAKVIDGVLGALDAL